MSHEINNRMDWTSAARHHQQPSELKQGDFLWQPSPITFCSAPLLPNKGRNLSWQLPLAVIGRASPALRLREHQWRPGRRRSRPLAHLASRNHFSIDPPSHLWSGSGQKRRVGWSAFSNTNQPPGTCARKIPSFNGLGLAPDPRRSKVLSCSKTRCFRVVI